MLSKRKQEEHLPFEFILAEHPVSLGRCDRKQEHFYWWVLEVFSNEDKQAVSRQAKLYSTLNEGDKSQFTWLTWLPLLSAQTKLAQPSRALPLVTNFCLQCPSHSLSDHPQAGTKEAEFENTPYCPSCHKDIHSLNLFSSKPYLIFYTWTKVFCLCELL